MLLRQLTVRPAGGGMVPVIVSVRCSYCEALLARALRRTWLNLRGLQPRFTGVLSVELRFRTDIGPWESDGDPRRDM